MGRSVLYIAQLDEVLRETKKALGATSVSVLLSCRDRLCIHIVCDSLTADLDHLNEMRSRIVEFFGLDPSKFSVKVEAIEGIKGPRLVFENVEEGLEIEVVKG